MTSLIMTDKIESIDGRSLVDVGVQVDLLASHQTNASKSPHLIDLGEYILLDTMFTNTSSSFINMKSSIRRLISYT